MILIAKRHVALPQRGLDCRCLSQAAAKPSPLATKTALAKAFVIKVGALIRMASYCSRGALTHSLRRHAHHPEVHHTTESSWTHRLMQWARPMMTVAALYVCLLGGLLLLARRLPTRGALQAKAHLQEGDALLMKLPRNIDELREARAGCVCQNTPGCCQELSSI